MIECTMNLKHWRWQVYYHTVRTSTSLWHMYSTIICLPVTLHPHGGRDRTRLEWD